MAAAYLCIRRQRKGIAQIAFARLGVEILLGGNHRLDWVTTYPFPALSRLWPEAAGIPGSDASNGVARLSY